MHQMYAPSYGARNHDLYLLGTQSPTAAFRLYRIPVDDVSASDSIAIDRNPGDLHLYSY